MAVDVIVLTLSAARMIVLPVPSASRVEPRSVSTEFDVMSVTPTATPSAAPPTAALTSVLSRVFLVIVRSSIPSLWLRAKVS